MTTKEKKNQTFLKQIENIGTESTNYQQIENNPSVFSDDLLFNFSFTVPKENIELIRNFVIEKRNSDVAHFHYNNSSAIREGINLLKEKYPNLQQRPKGIKFPARSGARGSLNGVETYSTSFSISEAHREFIYDYIYLKSLSTDGYNKVDFFADLVSLLTVDKNLK